MKIYTRTGDLGTTALFGGDRVEKHNLRIEAYGTVDETNAALGLARSLAKEMDLPKSFDALLHRIQSTLFILGADLATPTESKATVPRIEADHAGELEAQIDAFEAELPPLKHFIMPGGAKAAAAMHIARTVCRRAERLAVALSRESEINAEGIVYLNRLSDLLFVLARWVNQRAGELEEAWKPV
jgi:cob(I)alamin adenosyltransferase